VDKGKSTFLHKKQHTVIFTVRRAAIWTNSCVIMGDDIIVAGTMKTVEF